MPKMLNIQAIFAPEVHESFRAFLEDYDIFWNLILFRRQTNVCFIYEKPLENRKQYENFKKVIFTNGNAQNV